MFLVILIIIILLLSWLVAELRSKFPAYKSIRIFICLYILIGMISFIYVQFSPKEEYTLVSKDEIERLKMEKEKSWSLIDQNRANEINKEFLKEEWSFEVRDNKFSVINTAEDINVVVQWRDDPNSKEIFAKTYHIPSIVEGIDITTKIQLSESKYDATKNQLIITDSPRQKLNFYKFNNSFVVLGNVNSANHESYEADEFSLGTTFLYLNIPKNVTIIDEGGIVIFPNL